MDLWIEATKTLILVVMLVVAATAIRASVLLQALTSPLARRLAELHQAEPGGLTLNDAWLRRVQQRYETLLGHVDAIDATEFSCGEIETLPLKLLGRSLTASAAQSWIQQSPGILISLGLLGTFVGLTVGLSQISAVLKTAATPAMIMTALGGMIAPMGAAFQTSLLGLLLSLVVMVWCQLNGTRNCLERCELLLTSWLETVLPQQLGARVTPPLRQSIDRLNACVARLPGQVETSIERGMQQAFASRLEQVFDVQTVLAEEARRSVEQLAAVSSALNESGQDFMRAAQSLQHSSFASSLQESVQGLIDCREVLTGSTDSLSTRLLDLRDSLVTTQSEWKLLAKTAEQELSSCRQATEQMQIETRALRVASANLSEASQTSSEAAKQLREARLEVMRDRKLTLSVAEAIQTRLSSDSTLAESCQLFVKALQSCLDRWHQSMQQLDGLQTQLLNLAIRARREDAEILENERREAQESIRRMRQQLLEEVGGAIATQYQAITTMSEPTIQAGAIGRQLELQMDRLRQQLSAIADQIDARPDDDDRRT